MEFYWLCELPPSAPKSVIVLSFHTTFKLLVTTFCLADFLAKQEMTGVPVLAWAGWLKIFTLQKLSVLSKF